jgi:hypothetical protein
MENDSQNEHLSSKENEYLDKIINKLLAVKKYINNK